MKDNILKPQHIAQTMIQKALEFFPHKFLSQVKTLYDATWLMLHFRTHILKSNDLAHAAQDYTTYVTYTHPQAIKILKQNLDAESKYIIDWYVEKWKTIQENSILNYKYVHYDVKNQTKKLKTALKINRQKYPEFSIVPENFYYHSGLVFLPTRTLKHIQHKSIIDCGAYNGDSPLIFEKNYSFHAIYAFEPNATNYKHLLRTIDRYRLQKVIPVQKAVGISNTKGVYTESGSGSTIRISQQINRSNNVIEICTIDGFFRRISEPVGVIKMDIEGSELDALKGAVHTIRKYKPVLLISIYHTPEEFFEIKPYIESLHLDYRFMIRKLNPYKSLYEIMLIAY